MPHQCTDCGETYEDGSKQMLEGCAGCGGKKFQFRPEGWTPEPDKEEQKTPTQQSGTSSRKRRREHTGEDEAQSSARSDIVTQDELKDRAWPNAPEEQDERDSESATPTVKTTAVPPKEEEPLEPEDPYERDAWREEQKEMDSDELKEELNRQFESIRILEPGEYELNLMEIYEQEDFIISLQGDGEYMIEVPSYLDD